MAKYLTRSQASLYLGSLLCLGSTTDASGNVFTIESRDGGTSWGAAEPIDVAVQRWMTDGAVASTVGYENRELAFQVKIAATTSAALAAGEDALVTAARGAVTLSWVPPEGSAFAATTVFDLWTCHLAHQFNLDEENRLTRTYQVTATAKPWARSQGLTTAPAIPTAGTPTTASVDTGASTTGWTATPGTLSVFGGTAVRDSYVVTAADVNLRQTAVLVMTRTGSVTGMGTTPYLAIDHRVTGPWSNTTVKVDGQPCSQVGSSGTVKYWKVPATVTSFTTLTITATFNTPTSSYIGQTVISDVYDITRTNVGPILASHKMLNRHIEVGGSVPTSGSIQIASPSATILGTVLLYTCPDAGTGYSPAMRPYRISGGTVTVDATMVSGARETIGSTIIYDIPAGTLRPGTYVAVARLNFSATGSHDVHFRTLIPATGSLLEASPLLRVTSGAAGNVWGIIGALSVPGSAIPVDSQVATRIQFLGSAVSGTAPTLDELFLLDVTHGAFSLVTPATGGLFPFTMLWFDSPDAAGSNNLPQIYFGNNVNRSDAYRIGYSQIAAFGDHDLDPDGSLVFTVTDGVDDAAVTATYYQRWHTHAAA